MPWCVARWKAGKPARLSIASPPLWKAIEPSEFFENCRTVVGLEDKFIDLAFEAGDVQGMTPADIKTYIRFIADWRLRQLKLPAVYGVKENPLPWLQSLLSGVEHANFFEARATEYSKAATTGSWQGASGVWDAFDRMLARRGEEGVH